MKKITFLFVAMMAMTFASCGNGTSKCDTPANDSVNVATVDSTVVVADSLVEAVDSVVAE